MTWPRCSAGCPGAIARARTGVRPAGPGPVAAGPPGSRAAAAIGTVPPGTSPAAGYADLRASMETVIALRRAGLEFAVAPVPAAGGQALAPLGDGNAVTVFPYIDGAPGDFGDGLPERDRLALIGILAR